MAPLFMQLKNVVSNARILFWQMKTTRSALLRDTGYMPWIDFGKQLIIKVHHSLEIDGVDPSEDDVTMLLQVVGAIDCSSKVYFPTVPWR
jgi:hypothetical protein